MVVGESRVTNMVLRILGDNLREEVDSYVSSVCSRKFMVMNTMEQVNNIFSSSVTTFLSSLNYDELMYLRMYTGFNYKNINAILRGNWTYHQNGALTDEKREEYQKLSGKISSIVDKFDMPDIDFVCFRGTTLDSFGSYGIVELSQLNNLKGKYLYESAFTSTSILETSSYINKKLDDGRFCNIGIKYLIPSESNDGVLLTSTNISYSTSQNEFLLNSGSLSKVIDVLVDERNNTAMLTVVLVPKRIYELTYNKENNNKR